VVQPHNIVDAPKWKVELIDVAGNNRLLRDVLREFPIDIVAESGQRFVASPMFEKCSSVQEVHGLASRMQAVIEDVGKHDPELGRELAFKVGRVLEQRDDGTWIQHHRIIVGEAVLTLEGVTLQATVTVHPPSIVSDEDWQRIQEEQRRLEEERRERAYQDLRRRAISRAVSAFHDTRALQVQKLLAGPLTPLDMGHIAEVIQADMASAIRELTSTRQLTRFSRSINHPKVFGEQARHIVSEVEPPPDPMTLDEARNFIRSLASRWMERKAGL
jgi:hypothetical protein